MEKDIGQKRPRSPRLGVPVGAWLSCHRLEQHFLRWGISATCESGQNAPVGEAAVQTASSWSCGIVSSNCSDRRPGPLEVRLAGPPEPQPAPHGRCGQGETRKNSLRSPPRSRFNHQQHGHLHYPSLMVGIPKGLSLPVGFRDVDGVPAGGNTFGLQFPFNLIQQNLARAPGIGWPQCSRHRLHLLPLARTRSQAVSRTSRRKTRSYKT